MRTKLLSFLTLATLLICMSILGTAVNAQITYTLTMAVTGNGNTTPAVGVYYYDDGYVVNIAATPDNGWQFVNWTGDVADPSSANTSVTMNGNKTVTANFSQITYTLTMVVAGSGSTTPAVGNYPNYNYGEVVNITATPANGWQFVNWTGDVADPSSATTSVTMNGNKTVIANFSQITYTLTMAVTGNGSTTPAVGAYPNYNYGDVVNITATPANGWHFVNWAGDVADLSSATTSVTMNGNKTVIANFSQITYTLTMTVTGNGTTTPPVGNSTYYDGYVINITATPANGWHFVNWTGDVANPSSASTSVTMNGNKMVIANFSQITYTLTMAVTGNGSTTPAVGAYPNYNYGDVVNIAATPANGLAFR